MDLFGVRVKTSARLTQGNGIFSKTVLLRLRFLTVLVPGRLSSPHPNGGEIRVVCKSTEVSTQNGLAQGVLEMAMFGIETRRCAGVNV